MEYILAHDFGTSADKASLFTTEGRFVRTRTAAYRTHYAFGTQAEQDPEDWWRAFCENNKALLTGIDSKNVLCVSFDGTLPNCTCVGSDLKPLRRTMIWQDSRATLEAQELGAILPEKYRPNYRSGVTTYQTLPKLLWVKKNQPEIFAQTYKIFPSVMEYIILKMTTNAVCELSTATGLLNPERTDWADELLEMTGIPRSILPELHARTDVVGEVPQSLSAECGLYPGTRLVMGTGDTACTSIGAGLLNEGDAYMNGGTSAGIVARVANGRNAGGQTSSSGAAFSWLKNNLCLDEQRIARETGQDVYGLICGQIEKVPIGSNGVLFHPYLAGERAPRNNPHAKGSFTGITLTSTRFNLMRAVAEGIGLNVNLILQSVRDLGYELRRMPIVGGMGKSAVLREIFSDIMDVELVTYEYMDEAATVGAAVLGGIALGIFADESAVKKFMNITSVTCPNAENHEKYKKLMLKFEEVYKALEPVYDVL